MNDMSLGYAKDRLRRAHEVFRAAGGKPVKRDPAEEADPRISCEDWYTAAAVLMWFAAQAALQGGDYAFYVQAAQAMEAAAAAQGCA